MFFDKELTIYQKNKILLSSKLKAFTNDQLNIAQITISVFEMAGNIIRKGENVGYQQFFLYQKCFQKVSLQDLKKSGWFVKGYGYRA